MVLLGVVPAAHAAAMVVAPGEVFISDNGLCSLREAVINANNDALTHDDCPAGSGADTIDLPSAVYAFAPGPVRIGTDTFLVVSSDIVIQGAGKNATVLDGGGQARHVEVTSTGDLVLRSLQLVNGRAPGSGGGAILNVGTLTVEDTILSGNVADQGSGGAISNGVNSTATITDSTLSGNTADGNSGGGISNVGALTITNSTLGGNTADDGPGGAISNGVNGTATITDSTLSGNTADGNSGGGISNVGALMVTNTTLSGNLAIDSPGGGISNGTVGTATITNSTLSGNSFNGGAISNVGTLRLTNATLRAFSAPLTSPPEGPPSIGTPPGGEPTMILNKIGSTVARNTIVDTQGFGIHSCLGDPLDPGTHNLETGTGCGAGAGFTQVLAVHLEPLQNNGGLTQTHLPHPASPAINAGHQPTCDAISTGPDTEQRGFPRTIGLRCDVGAVEIDGAEGVLVLTSDVLSLGIDLRLKDSLLLQLAEAERAISEGATGIASDRLREFIDSVEAQRGTGIPEADADRLIAGASRILEILVRE